MIQDQELTIREKQWLVREEAILDAAQRLLHARGYSSMSMDELAAEVGISKATLYQHVESKEELAARAIVRSMAHMSRFIEEQDTTLPALTRLEAAIDYFVGRRYGNVPSGPIASKTLYPILQSHAEFQQHHARLMQQLEALVEEAQAEGSIVPHLPSLLLVRMILSCTRDPEYEILLAEGHVTADELRQTLMTFIFDGVRIPQHTPKP